MPYCIRLDKLPLGRPLLPTVRNTQSLSPYAMFGGDPSAERHSELRVVLPTVRNTQSVRPYEMPGGESFADRPSEPRAVPSTVCNTA